MQHHLRGQLQNAKEMQNSIDSSECQSAIKNLTEDLCKVHGYQR